jgi:hypothetical protein
MKPDPDNQDDRTDQEINVEDQIQAWIGELIDSLYQDTKDNEVELTDRLLFSYYEEIISSPPICRELIKRGLLAMVEDVLTDDLEPPFRFKE